MTFTLAVSVFTAHHSEKEDTMENGRKKVKVKKAWMELEEKGELNQFLCAFYTTVAEWKQLSHPRTSEDPTIDFLDYLTDVCQASHKKIYQVVTLFLHLNNSISMTNLLSCLRGTSKRSNKLEAAMEFSWEFGEVKFFEKLHKRLTQMSSWKAREELMNVYFKKPKERAWKLNKWSS